MQSSSQIITHNKPISSFLQAGCLSCRPTNSFKALKGKYHIPWTCLPQAHLGVFQLCLWPQIASGYLGGGLPIASHQPSDASMAVSQALYTYESNISKTVRVNDKVTIEH